MNEQTAALRKTAQVIAKMDPWYQDPDEGWVCVFCGSRLFGDQHEDGCSWVALNAALAVAPAVDVEGPVVMDPAADEARR